MRWCSQTEGRNHRFEGSRFQPSRTGMKIYLLFFSKKFAPIWSHVVWSGQHAKQTCIGDSLAPPCLHTSKELSEPHLPRYTRQ